MNAERILPHNRDFAVGVFFTDAFHGGRLKLGNSSQAASPVAHYFQVELVGLLLCL